MYFSFETISLFRKVTTKILNIHKGKGSEQKKQQQISQY